MADKRYLFRITQAGTSAPTATTIKNDFGTFVFTRTSAGVYVGTLAGAFNPITRATIFISDTTDLISYEITSIDTFTITTVDDSDLTDRLVDVNMFDATPASSSYYCSQTDLEYRIGTTRLAELTNDTANATTPNSTIVSAMISRADRLIDSLAGQVYTVPFVIGTNCTTIPEVIRQLSIDLSIYFCMSRRFAQMEIPKDWQEIYKQAMEKLQGISNLLIFLDGSPTILSAEGDIVAPTQKAKFADSTNQWYYFSD